jgi:antitoxin component YwqK of YwqJK toxin-antitoxin module
MLKTFKGQCPDLPEIIFNKVDDSRLWCKLSQLNKKFNQASKHLLVQLKTTFTITYSDDVITVTSIRTVISHNIKHGIAYLYYVDTNNLFCKSYYLNGKTHGKEETWYKNGKKRSLTYFNNGIPHGIHKCWNIKGKNIINDKYNHGLQCIRPISFSERLLKFHDSILC